MTKVTGFRPIFIKKAAISSGGVLASKVALKVSQANYCKTLIEAGSVVTSSGVIFIGQTP
ncbi:hypothetical protein HCZ88_08850 [Limosilactobacillus fermentum]